eukprot:s4474_g5.t1
MAPAQSKASKDAIKDRKQQLRVEFARGNAMRKHAKETGKEYDLSTPLLDDGTCTITLGSLMESENLKYEEAVEVMKRFRAEAEPEGGHWELPKLPKAKPSKASNKTASEGSVVAASDATKSEDAEPASKSAPKKRKAKDAGHDDNTASNKNPPEKAEPKAKAKAKAKGKAKAKSAAPPMDDAPEPEECPELAPAKKKKTKQPAKEPSAASSAKPTTNSKKRAKQEAAEADPTSEPTPEPTPPAKEPSAASSAKPTTNSKKRAKQEAAEADPTSEPTPEPTPEPVTRSKKVKKGKKAKSSKLRKLRAKEDLGEEAEEEQHEEEEEETTPTEKSANIKAEVEAMIREIDEQMNMPEEKEKASPAPARPEPSAASSAKPTTNSKKRAKQEAAEADPTSEPTPEPTPDPTPEPVTRSKKEKKGKKAKSSKLRKLRAKEDLGEEAEEEQHEEEEEEEEETAPTEKSANIKAEVEAMIREIDEQMNMPEEKEKASPAPARPVVNHRRMSKGPPTEPPTSPTPKAKSQAWPHERQPENADEAALHGGWSCLSLELGEKQLNMENTGPDYDDTVVNGSSVSELLELGASASQVTNNNADLNQIMTLVGQLQKQLARQQERRDTDAKAADDAAALAALEDQPGHTEDENLDGEVAEDHELEAQAEAEMLENVESEVSSRRDEEANQAAKEAAKKAANPPQRADRDCPGVVEETKYWVTTEESKTDTVDIGHEERMTINATPTSTNAFNILAGPSTPGAEIKRELASLSSLLIDLPQEDDLTQDIDKYNKRLKALALKTPVCI